METNFNNFINENKQENILPLPIRDEKYQFLLNLCKKCEASHSQTFNLKEPLEIGTCGNHALYLNYIDKNNYENRLSFWFIYNEQPDELYGTSWDSGVLYEENGKLVSTDEHDEITLLDNFMDVIYNHIKLYPDLDAWCKEIVYIHDTDYKYSTGAIISSNEKEKYNISWENRIEWMKVKIMSDKLLNRHSEPYDQKTLDEMLELGEEKYNKLSEERNKRMMDIFNELDEEGAFDNENKKDINEN